MAISSTTIKKLFALSGNRCAMFGCEAHLVIGQTVIAEICHIRARRKNGPRYDPKLTAAQKDAFDNLLLLCPTDHTLIDKDKDTYSPEVLESMKENHENGVVADLSIEDAKRALMILEVHNTRAKVKSSSKARDVTASASGGSAAVAFGGSNHGKVEIKITNHAKGKGRGYPANSIGGDANLSGYVDYLFDIYADYMSSLEDEGTSRGKLGKHLKSRFRIGSARTRYHIPAEKFYKVVDYLIHEKLAKTPVGRKHVRNGTRLCRSFDEWRLDS